MNDLQVRLEGAKSEDLGSELGQDRVNGGGDRSAVGTAQDELGDGGNDEDLRLPPDVGQRIVDSGERHTVNDLGCLHSLARGNVQPSHVSSNVEIANDGEKTRNGHFRVRKTLVVVNVVTNVSSLMQWKRKRKIPMVKTLG